MLSKLCQVCCSGYNHDAVACSRCGNKDLAKVEGCKFSMKHNTFTVTLKERDYRKKEKAE